MEGSDGNARTHRQRREEDESAQLAALLRHVSPSALLAALPHVRLYTEDGRPASSTDPTAGVLHRQDVLEIATAMDETHLRTLLDSFATRCSGAVTLVQAALGWNRTSVRRLYGRRSQLAARAMGLLPLEKPDELMQRYLTLTRYQREVGGMRAEYHIHLATGAIYLGSGQYLCIASSPKERKAIYLPFEDGGEPISSEIISKVLLLANDMCIADTTILAQITPLRQAV